MNVAIDKLTQVHKTFQLDRPSASAAAAGTAESADGHRKFRPGGDQVNQAADNDTSSATAAAAGTAAEAADGNGGQRVLLKGLE